jgi:hypothetical protein
MALAARVGAALGLVSVRTRGHALGNFHGSSDDVGRLAAFFRDEALEEKARRTGSIDVMPSTKQTAEFAALPRPWHCRRLDDAGPPRRRRYLPKSLLAEPVRRTGSIG